MAHQPICVRRTSTVEEADIIVAWLEERGVEVTVPDRANPGVLAFGVTDDEGIAIVARDEETARRATTLLAEHDQETDRTPDDADATETLDIECDECGNTVAITRGVSGSVQQCPHCGAYVDTPAENG